jgi:hypothetical protein
MSETRFRAEMEGIFASGADSLFTRAVLERATADYMPATLQSLRGPARVLGGTDWGATNDRSACVAIARLPLSGGDSTPVFGVAMVQRWAAGYPLTQVIDELAAAPAHWQYLTLETNGLGMPCAQMLARKVRERPDAEGGALRRTHVIMDESPAHLRPPPPSAWQPERGWSTRLNPVHVDATMKAATYSALRLLLDGGQLVLPAVATELLRELMLLRVDLSPSGIEHIEASSGHDDLADALALALGPYRDPSRRWRTLLTEVANPRRAQPAPEQPPSAGPTVTTGAGLAVPAVPVWQSVAGRHVTTPPGTKKPHAPKRIGTFTLNARSAA